jgi:hypothetical protein
MRRRARRAADALDPRELLDDVGRIDALAEDPDDAPDCAKSIG